MSDNSVTFTAKDYKNQGQWKDVTIPGEEFIRRFLMHVPPKRFVRIRHYGLLSSRNKSKKITLCRNLLGCKKYISRLKGLDAPSIIKLLYNKDICKCISCGGNLITLPADYNCTRPTPHMLCQVAITEYFSKCFLRRLICVALEMDSYKFAVHILQHMIY